MSKYIKRYNETTREWEVVSAPDVSVVQKLEDGSDITDTNVIVTNYNYLDESGDTKTLEETLTVISDDISKLQRNVSWLAEHGGGGGTGGGGGSSSSFKISITSPTIENGRAYISSDELNVEFMIEGGADGDICSYAYQFDTNPLTDYTTVEVNKPVKLKFDLSNSSLAYHTMIIRAVNPYGVNIAAKSFNIYKSTLKLVFDAETAGQDYENEVLNIMQNKPQAYIPLLLTNGLEGSKVVITAEYNTEKKNLTIDNVPVGTSKRQFNFWDIVPKGSVLLNTYYTIKFSAVSTLGNNTAKAEDFQVRIKVINPNELTISIGVNGQNTDEAINAPLDSTLNYNFKTYAPLSISRVYYSAKIVNGDNSYLILGKYYDENLHAEGATTYSDNDSTAVETTISSQYMINSGDFAIGDNITLYVRVWDVNGTKEAEETRNILVDEASNNIFARQYQRRDGNEGQGDTMFASWNRSNLVATSPFVWTSRIHNYTYLDDTLAQSENSAVTTTITVLNANNSSGVKTNTQPPYLRLQNNAYGLTDMSYYANEIRLLTSSRNKDGFTISVSLMGDNHTDNQHTLFMWGENDAQGKISKGIRIDVDKIYWNVTQTTEAGSDSVISLDCNFSCESRATVDFSFTHNGFNNTSTIRIYVNGILNAAKTLYRISDRYFFPNIAYFGCGNTNGQLTKFSDVNFYEFSIYSKTLTDFQMIVNDKAARLLGSPDDPAIIAEYGEWKIKNFITAKEDDPSTPESVLFKNGEYITGFTSAEIYNIAQQSSIPTLYIDFQGSTFSANTFYTKYTDKSITGQTFEGEAYYYDPSTNRSVNMRVRAGLQGTSTLGYRVKNLEIYMNEKVVIDGTEVLKLFQPKKEWFPESQFTLKADVVDSAHANNAVLGQWINESGILKDTPAMAAFSPETRPKDVDDQGNPHTHIGSHGVEIDYDEDVTIKHTLEGFPILLFVHFSDQNLFNFLGIYSFNLGRYSYFNMGIKFLNSFSRYENGMKVSCPKVINYYKEKQTLGDISVNDIFSFEMGNNANANVIDYPVWSQYNKKIVQSYGKFEYPTDVTEGDTIWDGLCNLFLSTASFPINNYGDGQQITLFNNKKFWTLDANGNYIIERDVDIPQDADQYYSPLVDSIDVENAVGYFIICNAFGMTDSLGKNMTLRTWDNGQKWYTCFYDMDTALGLANDGSEGNLPTVCIDKVTMVSDPMAQTTTTGITYHTTDSSYAAFLSKLWGIFRSESFLYRAGKTDTPYYEDVWNSVRSAGAKLAKSTNFSDIMANRVNQCGELIYNYDYNSKYISDTTTTGEEGAQAGIDFLHGTRVEFVKNWLRKHFYFLDGIFDARRVTSKTYVYEDSPYNADQFTFVAFYDSVPNLVYTMQVSTPSFVGISVGAGGFKKFYISEANLDTVIYYTNNTSPNSQITFNGSSLITKLDGLQNSMHSISSSNQNGVVRSLCKFDASHSNIVLNDAFKPNAFLYNNKSSLEELNLSNTRGAEITSYSVNLENFDKMLRINISNSDVTQLLLPASSLQYLNFTYSNITNLTIRNQNVISAIDLTGCDKLTSLDISNCSAISNMEVINKPNLASFTISDCEGLESLTISGNTALSSITISNCHNLTNLVIDNCENAALVIRILDNDSALENISFTNLTNMTEIITLPNADALSHVTAFTVSNCYKLGGWKFNDTPLETYDGDNVFDISPFTSLEGENLSIRNLNTLKYLRIPNDDGSIPVTPLNFYATTLSNCKSLTKIFGYINICQSNTFEGCHYFYINHDSSNTGLTPDFIYVADDPYYTNVAIGTDSLSSAFRETNCDINDVYYILHLCNSTTIKLNNLFNGCGNVVTTVEHPLDDNTFTNCTNVDNINGIFNGCSINGIISVNLLQPLINNLTEFDTVFTGNYGLSSIESCFFPVGNIIEKINNFNPKALQQSNPSRETYFRDPNLLTNLTSLKYLLNSFNDCQIDFTFGKFDATELFMYNTELLSIENSFRGLKNCYGHLGNIFGGYSNDLNLYPRKLERVINSFIIDSGNHDGIDLYEGDRHKGVILPLGDSFLKSIAGTITYITGMFPGENRDYSYDSTNTDYMPSFCGKGILKMLDNFTYTDSHGDTHNPDCHGEDFPYQILKDCVNLKEYPCLFEDVHNYKNDGNGNIVDINITLPNNMFESALTLENISCFFANMHKNIVCTLSGEGFKHSAIVNANRLFATNIEGNDHIEFVGQIPYKLFYQEISGNTTQEGLTLEDALTYGISVNTANTFADIAEFTSAQCQIDDVCIVYNDENNGGKLSEYKVVGFTEGIADWSKQSLDITGTLASVTTKTNFSNNFVQINPTIKTAQSALSGIHSTGMTPYTAVINTWEDLVEDNPLYNPILFILEGNNYRLNANCNPFKKNWNKYVFDNTTGFSAYIASTGVLNEVDAYGNDIVNHSLMPAEFTANFVKPIQYNQIDEFCLGHDEAYLDISTKPEEIKKLFVTNYFTPGDIFKYFANRAKTSVNDMFSNSSGELRATDDGYYIEGLRGTIPAFIFEPLSNIEELRGVFSSCSSLFPYEWHSVIGSQETIGITYPPTLFKGLTSLYSVSSIFSYGRIWGRTVIPAMFSELNNLSNASYLWTGAKWIEKWSLSSGHSIYSATTVYQINNSIFANNGALTSVAHMLEGSYTESIDKITQILTPSTNPNLSDCSYFLYYASNTHGTVPPFWNWTTYQLNSYHYAFKGLNYEYIDNYDADLFERFVRDE